MTVEFQSQNVMKPWKIPFSAIIDVFNVVYEERKEPKDEPSKNLGIQYEDDVYEALKEILAMRKLSYTFAYGEHMVHLIGMLDIRISPGYIYTPIGVPSDAYTDYTRLEKMPLFWKENICNLNELNLEYLDFEHHWVVEFFEGLFVKNAPNKISMRSCRHVDFRMLGPKFPRTVEINGCSMKFSTETDNYVGANDTGILNIKVIGMDYCICNIPRPPPHTCQMPTNVETLTFNSLEMCSARHQIIRMFECHTFPRLKTAEFHVVANTGCAGSSYNPDGPNEEHFRTPEFVQLFEKLKHVTASRGFSVSMTKDEGDDEDDEDSDFSGLEYLFEVSRN